MPQDWQAEFTTLRARCQQLTLCLERFDDEAELITLSVAQARAREAASQELEQIDRRAEWLTALLRRGYSAKAG
jgi:hypothetical protein